MGWGTDINRSGKGIIWSTDCNQDTAREGMQFTCIDEVCELVQCIDHVLGLRLSENLPRLGNGERIQVCPSEQQTGKWVISRAGGNWVRLDRDEIWGLRNELLKRLAP